MAANHQQTGAAVKGKRQKSSEREGIERVSVPKWPSPKPAAGTPEAELAHETDDLLACGIIGRCEWMEFRVAIDHLAYIEDRDRAVGRASMIARVLATVREQSRHRKAKGQPRDEIWDLIEEFEKKALETEPKPKLAGIVADAQAKFAKLYPGKKIPSEKTLLSNYRRRLHPKGRTWEPS